MNMCKYWFRSYLVMGNIISLRFLAQKKIKAKARIDFNKLNNNELVKKTYQIALKIVLASEELTTR